ncbi:PGF-CTERM sorting domain-containing protein [Halorussus salilacus]|nr:PGF-CTERM sorting domain-containing protein [Halorussus salilacus]USZ68513.1 PGF-CTERM sorting domain-containing protein [Halorussus salilacus]
MDRETTETEGTDEGADVPGFGVGAALTALAAAGLLARRLN